MERALAKFIECEKEKEEQRRCKGEKLKIDRECQVHMIAVSCHILHLMLAVQKHPFNQQLSSLICKEFSQTSM